MKTKLQQITELSIRTTESLTSNLEQWESFLKCSAWNYKYSFADQILIYAQRPDATACASIDVWNQKLHRWVNRGAKGIALISENDNSYRLRYVFDIADTDGKSPINLWNIENNQNQIVTKHLSNIYENDAKQGYFNDCSNIKLSPDLEKVLFKSAEYMVLTRCGLKVDKTGLENIVKLKGLQNIVQFGTISNVITRDVLSKIAKEISTISIQQKSNNAIDNKIEKEYNVAISINDTGGNDNERNQLQERGRLLSSGFGTTSGQQMSWEIRNDEEKSSQRKQPSVIQRIENNGATDGTLFRSGGNSQQDDGIDDKRDGTSKWNNGTTESPRSDEMGRSDEQHSPFGGRSGSEGTHIRLIQTLPTVEEQQNIIQQAEEYDTSSALFISQMDIDSVLTLGSGFSEGKYRIYQEIQKNEDANENIFFLKKEYGIGGGSHTFPDDTSGWSFHDGKGIKIIKTTDNIEEKAIQLTWKKALKRIRELVAGDKYLTDEEKLKYSVFLTDKNEPNTENSLEPDKSVKRDGLLEKSPHTETMKNFRIKDKSFYAETKSERFKNNVDAIKLLKSLEEAQRLATPEEQVILSKYVGWGGLADCFDERNSKYAMLKTLLTEDEYISARESTLTAFYTPPYLIDAMYKTLENLGFCSGNVLEPSCGTGNFIGLLPENMIKSKVYGVELDSLTGRIAKQLYQKSSVVVQGFETVTLPDNFFDVAIGNVPFGQFKIADKMYDKQNWLIHDYFFGKTLDKVRPGGVIAFITSKGTLDKENPTVRKYIAHRAELIGAIRLPNNAFKAYAGTEVTSDIIFLQKRDHIVDVDPDWVHLNKDKNGLTMNQYFIDHPNMIIGEMKEVSGPYGPETACVLREGQNISESLNNAIDSIHGEITGNDVSNVIESEDLSIPANPDVRNFSYAVIDDTVYFRENSRMLVVDAPETKLNRIKGLAKLRNCVRSIIELQMDDCPDNVIQEKQN